MDWMALNYSRSDPPSPNPSLPYTCICLHLRFVSTTKKILGFGVSLGFGLFFFYLFSIISFYYIGATLGKAT